MAVNKANNFILHLICIARLPAARQPNVPPKMPPHLICPCGWGSSASESVPGGFKGCSAGGAAGITNNKENDTLPYQAHQRRDRTLTRTEMRGDRCSSGGKEKKKEANAKSPDPGAIREETHSTDPGATIAPRAATVHQNVNNCYFNYDVRRIPTSLC